MTKKNKLLQKMRNNPRDWRIEDLKTLADALGIDWYHEGSSHVIFQSPSGAHQSIPARRPIKPIYIKRFMELINEVKEVKYGTP